MNVNKLFELLPNKFQNIVYNFDIIDKIYCILTKRKLPCELSKLRLIYLEIFAHISSLDSFSLLCNDLIMICTLCPNYYKIRNYYSISEYSNNRSLYCYKPSNISKEIELIFIRYAGISNVYIKERRRIVIESLFEILFNHYNINYTNTLDREVNLKLIQKKGFPIEYNIDLSIFPEVDVDLKSMMDNYLTSINNTNHSNSFTNNHLQTISNIVPINTSSDTTTKKEVLPISIDDVDGAEGVLEYLKNNMPNYNNQIKHVEKFLSKDAIYESLESPLLPTLLLEQLSCKLDLTKGFYRHQAKGINAIRKSKHVVVSTATASGKSLIYNIPILESILNNPQITALYLFPTKALSQDQLRSLSNLIYDNNNNNNNNNSMCRKVLPVGISTCDGDTTQAERVAIQGSYNTNSNDNDSNNSFNKINIILTNPDMLHCTLLPDHHNWKEVFTHLKYVVIDEAHMYSGAFGSHVSAILRRLVRLCLYYQQSYPQFICCSATIANPLEHMRKLVPVDAIIQSFGLRGGCYSSHVDVDDVIHEYVTVVDSKDDGAPQRERLFAIWNPAVRYNKTEIVPDTNNINSEVSITHYDTNTEYLFNSNPNTHSISPCEHLPDPTLSNSSTKNNNNNSNNTITSLHNILTNDDLIQISPKKRHFLQVCEDTRPSTIGTVGPIDYLRHTTTTNNSISSITTSSVAVIDKEHVWEVNYVGGWKRGRKQQQPQLISQRAVDNNNNNNNNNSSILHAHPSYEIKPTPVVTELSRASSICDTANLFTAIIKKRLRCIAFCKVRKLVELVLNYTINNLEQNKDKNKNDHVETNRSTEDSDNTHLLIPYISSYRGGYTKEERRMIEYNLFHGKLLGVTATCALELGIDIGTLDITLHMGFPGSFSSLWQQAGRAGRSMDHHSCLSILICFDCPVDQYFARNPKVLFHSSNEYVRLDVNNNQITLAHLLCAAKEIPLNYSFIFYSNNNNNNNNNNAIKSFDSIIWGIKYYEILQYLIESFKLHPCSNNNNNISGDNQKVTLHSMWKIASRSFDLIKMINIRMVDPITINILDDSRDGIVIDSIGYSRAFYELYEGAIYMHRAIQYLVVKLDLIIAHIAHTIPVKVKYYTSASNKTVVNIIKELQSDDIIHIGNVQVISQVYGYVKKWLGSGEIFDKGECSLPPLEYESTAFWIDLPIDIKHTLEHAHYCPISCLHTANHVLKSLSVCYAQQCDLNDIGTEHMLSNSALEHPFRILVYDKRCGGIDASISIYEHRNQLIQQAYDVIANCICTNGCPSCIFDHRCSLYNQNLNKAGTLLLLQLLITYQANDSSPSSIYDNDICNISNINTNTNKSDNPILNFEYSPRKAARKNSQKKAKYRDSEKAHKLAIQINWTDSNPLFIQD